MAESGPVLEDWSGLILLAVFGPPILESSCLSYASLSSLRSFVNLQAVMSMVSMALMEVNCLPVIAQGGPRLGVTVLVAVVFGAVLRVHFVKRCGREGMVGRMLAWPGMVAGAGVGGGGGGGGGGAVGDGVGDAVVRGAAVEAGSGLDGREAVSGKARVSRAVCVCPLPAAVLAMAQVVEVAGWRQGRRGAGLACSRNGHGCGRAREWWPVVVWQ